MLQKTIIFYPLIPSITVCNLYQTKLVGVKLQSINYLSDKRVEDFLMPSVFHLAPILSM